VTPTFWLIASLLLALSFSATGLAADKAGNTSRINVDVECRCPDPVGQSFCADFKKKVGESAAYKLVDNAAGYGLGVHFTCVDLWKGLNDRLAGHMSAVSLAFTIYADTLPGELLEDNSVFRVGLNAIPEMSRQIVSALGQIVTANGSLFERLRVANETSGASTGSAATSKQSPESKETSGASTGSAATSKPSPESIATPSAGGPAENQPSP
jgi:hypothetical protein